MKFMAEAGLEFKLRNPTMYYVQMPMVVTHLHAVTLHPYPAMRASSLLSRRAKTRKTGGGNLLNLSSLTLRI